MTCNSLIFFNNKLSFNPEPCYLLKYNIIFLFLGTKHASFNGQNYFFSWENAATQDLNLNWVTGRNICRRHCMDLVSIGEKKIVLYLSLCLSLSLALTFNFCSKVSFYNYSFFLSFLSSSTLFKDRVVCSCFFLLRPPTK